MGVGHGISVRRDISSPLLKTRRNTGIASVIDIGRG